MKSNISNLEKDIKDAEVRIFRGCLWKSFKLAFVGAVISYVVYSETDCDRKDNYVISEKRY